jgi:serine protease Do
LQLSRRSDSKENQVRGKQFGAKIGLLLVVLAVTSASSVARPGTGPEVSFQRGFAPIVKRCLPGVVNISSTRLIRKQGSASPLFSDPLFRQLFGDQFSGQIAKPREEREESLGSGVIVSPDGYILTNEHVVDGATHIKVALQDQREFEARVVGKDAPTDIAVLKVDATGLPVIPFGNSSKMLPGDFVLAIGDPFGVGQTVTMGIVSAVGRGDLGIEDYEDFIQTDAAINPGNSGGALISARGELIGINTAILSGGGGSQGVGFAIPINLACQVMDQIMRNGRVIRAWLGVTLQPVTAGIAQSFGLLGEPRGALVAEVSPKSPAADAGLAVGDLIVDVNGKRVPDSRDLSLRIAMMAPDSLIHLKVLRNGMEREVAATLIEAPSSKKAAAVAASAAGPTNLMDGVDVAELTPEIAGQLQLPAATRGVVVTDVDAASLAAEAGLEHGDIVEQVNHKPVSSVSEFQQAVHAAGPSPVLLLINHGGNTRFLVVEPD